MDASLVEAAATDPSALERLIAAVWPEAYRLSFGILRDRGHAEDAAQEACAAMSRSLSSLKDAAAFRAWFYRLVVNESISLSRRQHESVTLRGAALEPIACNDIDALDLYDALGRLPTTQRAVVLLYYYAGLTSREIAIAAKLPAPTVRYHLMLARRALRRALKLADPTATKEVFSNAR